MAISERQMKRMKKYCREPIENIKGYEEALKSPGRYHCHHINQLTFTSDELKKMNMYYNRPASELVLLTPSEHSKLHHRHDMPSYLHGDKSPCYHKYGDRHPRYKENVSLFGEFTRATRLFKRGLITEEGFQAFRDKLQEYRRMKRKEERAHLQRFPEEYYEEVSDGKVRQQYED